MDRQSKIKEFAETLAEELRDDYGGDLSEDERSKFHYALMFNSMTIAWKRMLKHQIKEGEEDEESYKEDDLDETKGLVHNQHYNELQLGSLKSLSTTFIAEKSNKAIFKDYNIRNKMDKSFRFVNTPKTFSELKAKSPEIRK